MCIRIVTQVVCSHFLFLLLNVSKTLKNSSVFTKGSSDFDNFSVFLTLMYLFRDSFPFIDCNWTRTQNHLVRKRTLNPLGSLARWLSVRFRTKCFCVRVQLQSLGLFHIKTFPIFKNFAHGCSIINFVYKLPHKVPNNSKLNT